MALHVLFNSSKPCLISFKNCCKFRSEISFQVRCSLCLFFFFHPLMENCVRELDVLTLEFLKQKRLCLLSTPYIGPELFHQTKNFVRLSNQFSRINKTKQKLIITTRKKRKRKNRKKKSTVCFSCITITFIQKDGAVAVSPTCSPLGFLFLLVLGLNWYRRTTRQSYWLVW